MATAYNFSLNPLFVRAGVQATSKRRRCASTSHVLIPYSSGLAFKRNFKRSLATRQVLIPYSSGLAFKPTLDATTRWWELS